MDFNPTSRQHIAWALQNFRGARFTKVTDTGKPKVDEATLSEMRDLALAQGNKLLHEECEMFIRLLTLQKWWASCLRGQIPGSTQLKMMGVFTTAALLRPKRGATPTGVPTLDR